MDNTIDHLVYDKTYDIKSFEVSVKNELKAGALLHYLEDIAYLQAQELGFGYDAIAPKGATWVVLRYHLNFAKWPQAWQKITIRTHPCKPKAIQAFREFEIVSETGEVLGTAGSAWTIIDLATRRPQILTKVTGFPENLPEQSIPTAFGGWESFDSSDFEKVFEIRFDDIDINRHVNNANYITWALEALPHEFRMEHSIAEIEIAYKQEISYGSKVLSKAAASGNQTRHRLMNNETDEILCDISISWAI
jgi:medium-chain acyl-[acyl-carrier-protein] hydrolase